MAARGLGWVLTAVCLLAKSQAGSESLYRRYDADEILVDDERHDIEFFNFVTRPDIDAPKWEIKIYNESAVAPGLWFVAPYGIVDQTHNDKAYVAPHIYDGDGELIWSGAAEFDNYNTFAFKVSNVGGKDMLTALHPHSERGVIMDDKYQIQEEIHVGEYGETTNMHDFQIVDNGTKAVYLNHEITHNMRNSREAGYTGGPCTVSFNGIEEQDIETREITFTWSSFGKIALDESIIWHHSPAEICEYPDRHNSKDYLHLNAIEKLDDGDYLISGRRTDTIYKISHVDGSIVWRLGGKKNDFDLDGHFSGQHDVRCLFQNSTHLTLTIMDNAMGPGWPKTTNDNSRGLVLSVNQEAMTAKAIKAYNHPNNGYAEERGNFQTLPNGNAMIWWTHNALGSEHTPEGEVVKVAKLRSGLKTYRGWKAEWVGHPQNPPDVHSELFALQGELKTVVHVSWNGATEVAVWNLYKTNARGNEKELLLGAHRTGFETAIVYPGYIQYVVLEPVDHLGNSLGESMAFETLKLDSDDITDPELLKEWKWLQDHPEANEYIAPTTWMDEAKEVVHNPLFTFVGGILFCVAAGLSAWGVWICWRRCIRRRKQKLYAALDNDDRVDETYYDKDSPEEHDLDDLTRDDND